MNIRLLIDEINFDGRWAKREDSQTIHHSLQFSRSPQAAIWWRSGGDRVVLPGGRFSTHDPYAYGPNVVGSNCTGSQRRVGPKRVTLSTEYGARMANRVTLVRIRGRLLPAAV